MTDILEILPNNKNIDILKIKLLKLLEKQMKVYTRGESSSIKTEVAEELFDSLCYTLNICSNNLNQQAEFLLEKDLEVELLLGQEILKKKIKCGRTIWKKICENMDIPKNLSMIDTLKSIGVGFDMYDYSLFACEFPASIDYQLSIPISENLRGIDYVNSYLEQLHYENQFLLNYNFNDMIFVLNNYCKDYYGLLINVFEPIFTRAVCNTLLDKPDGCLNISDDDINKIRLIVLNMNRISIENYLISACDYLLQRYEIKNKEFFHKYCKELAGRIHILRDFSNLKGVL